MEVGAGERSGIHALRSFLRTPLFYQRAVLIICACTVSASVFYSSRLGSETTTKAAFSVSSSSRGYIRISGDVRHAGIYPISVNIMTGTAIKMAVPVSGALDGLSPADAEARLVNGMSLHISRSPNGPLMLTRSNMTTNERLVLGIPLDINAMSAADFDALPGIGAKMSQRIVVYRQKNGGTMAVSDLIFIEGIGDNKYKQLLKYF